MATGLSEEKMVKIYFVEITYLIDTFSKYIILYFLQKEIGLDPEQTEGKNSFYIQFLKKQKKQDPIIKQNRDSLILHSYFWRSARS